MTSLRTAADFVAPGIEFFVGHLSVVMKFLDDGYFHPVLTGHVVKPIAVLRCEVILSYRNGRIREAYHA